MTIKGEIHWCEGLFLQPHHLQSMQRQILEKFTREHRLRWNYPYGVIEARISDDQGKSLRSLPENIASAGIILMV
ncbi:MAG: hypothetical protein ACYSW3_22770 [Planctomycetota bacterium]|jgi:predicted component of type VI protein secretion system